VIRRGFVSRCLVLRQNHARSTFTFILDLR
jgi:hypothetical protein